ncbi:TonB-dependent receptor [Sphingobium amiense]|nr:TonB-dependent receptor [Sphingobium amiense]
MFRKITTLLMTAAPIAIGASPSFAQDNAGATGSLEDIVVTAQKRSENLQDVPVAITAVTSARLESAGITSAADLGTVTPNLSLTQVAGTIQPHIRGVGTDFSGPGVENPVALYVDGVYIASGTSSLLTLNNIERVEVLKGPQGTLFGRNATGGLIHVITKDPGYDPSMALDLSYANYETVTANAYLSAGLADGVAADLAVRYEHQGKGWGTNLFNGRDVNRTDHDFAVRSKLLFEPGDRTKIRFAIDYADRKAADVQHAYPGYPQSFNNPFFGGPFPLGGPFDTNSNVQGDSRLRSGGISLQINQDLGDVALQSITAFRKSRYMFELDLDLTPVQLISCCGADGGPVRARQFSQEFQLSSTSGGPLKWVAGAYLFSARDGYENVSIELAAPVSFIPGVPAAILLNNRVTTRSAAAFGQASYEILDNTTLTLGGRLTYEKRTIGGTESIVAGGVIAAVHPLPAAGSGFPGKIDFTRFNYRIALDHKFTPDILGYVSYNTGFKSGGYNLNSSANPPYRPEQIKAAEVGLKTELLDRRLRLNIAAFHYNYSNIQVTNYAGGNSLIGNGAAAKIYGVDFDADLVLGHGLSLNGGLGYLHGRFSSYDNAPYFNGFDGCVTAPGSFCTLSAKGNRVGQSPTWSYNVGANYKTELAQGALAFSVLYSYSSRWYASADNFAFQPSYGLLNASVQWTEPSDHLSVRLWGKNLTNEVYATGIGEANQGVFRHLGAPRTYGVTLGVKF